MWQSLLKFAQKNLKKLEGLIKSFVKKYPYLTSCIALILVLHLSFFVASALMKKHTKIPLPKKLAIKTFIMPEMKVIEKSEKTPSQTKVASAPKPKPAPKKAPVKKVVKKTAAKKDSDLKRKKLLEELQKSIASIEETSKTEQNPEAISVPKPISELKADAYEIKSEMKAEEEENALEYASLLVSHLKDTLSLPGSGTVKIKLTLSHTGSIERLAVISSDSEVNRLYLEKHLYDLSFPSFTKELSHLKSHTFSLTFCSE